MHAIPSVSVQVDRVALNYVVISKLRVEFVGAFDLKLSDLLELLHKLLDFSLLVSGDFVSP